MLVLLVCATTVLLTTAVLLALANRYGLVVVVTLLVTVSVGLSMLVAAVHRDIGVSIDVDPSTLFGQT